MTAPKAAKTGRSVRALPEQWARWEALARSKGQDVSEWVRDACDAVARAEAGGVEPPEDAEFVDAVGWLRAFYPVRHPSEIVRMAVMAALAREKRAPGHAFAMQPDAEMTGDVRPKPGSGRPGPGRSGR